MTPIYLNSLSNDQYKEHQFLCSTDHHRDIQIPSPNSQASSSSNSPTCHLFFNPTTIHDQDAVFNRDSHDQSQNEDDNFRSQAYHDDHVENQDERVRSNDGLKISVWKRETYDHRNDENQVKWTSSKMRVMLKMKKTNPMKLNTSQSTTTEVKLEDHKEEASSPILEENANSNSINTTCSNNSIPIRVCSDCNTTKTPLWRSGPEGPKSLCNACGIRQRKVRKAMAAAAAETSRNDFIDKPTSLKATKILHKDQKKTNNGHVTKYKKRQFSKQINNNPLSSSSSPVQKNRVEDFLIGLRKNLAFHGVFPQDEKEAAILLMALSCGYVHQ